MKTLDSGCSCSDVSLKREHGKSQISRIRILLLSLYMYMDMQMYILLKSSQRQACFTVD